MSTFATVETHADSLNAIFQSNAKHDCVPLCMLLYHEYFFFPFFIPINLFGVDKPVPELGLQAH